MPNRDETRWVESEEQIDGQTTYERILVSPEEPPTDEVRTQEELQETELLNEEEAEANEIDATDAAIEAAAELGVDLASVSGSGVDGRITKADVEAAATG